MFNMPNIRRIENKRVAAYKIRICRGYDEKNKKIVETFTYHPDPAASLRQQEKDATRYALELEEKIKFGTSFNSKKMTFEAFAADWLKRRQNEVSFNTYKGNEMMLRTRVIPYFRTYKLSKIKLPIVESFLLTLIESSSQSTIQKYNMLLNSMFKTAVRWGMIEKNPCENVKLPKSKKGTSDIKFFTPEQARAFLASLDIEFELTYKGHSRIDDTGKPYTVADYTERRGMPMQLKVFFYIAMTCGMRRGEILALHWDDIDFSKKTIRISKSVTKTADGVTCKAPKTATSVRTIPLPELIVPLLMQYRVDYNAFQMSLGDKWRGKGNMFTQADGKLMGMHTPYQRLVSHIERYNDWIERVNEDLPQDEKKLERLPKIPFHGLRHTCATLLNDMGTSISIISKILGHAQTSTTMNIYAHSFESQLREASNNMDGFLSKCVKDERPAVG